MVHDSDNLDEPYMYEGSVSSHIVHRLHQAGFESKLSKSRSKQVETFPSNHLCYPGQIVHTKKKNLRLGHWLLGEYNANVEPYGMVIGTRSAELKVEWLLPNVFIERELQSTPPVSLNTDDIQSGDIILYDRSERPKNGLSSQLKDACYSPDFAYGNFVGFKDPAGAAVKYGRQAEEPGAHAIFNRIPRVETDGFDMNIFRVVQTATTLVIEWQNGIRTLESACDLEPYQDIDDHDVWPGDKISHQEYEQAFSEDGTDFIRMKKIGVVQSVSKERTARVRWFEVSPLSSNICRPLGVLSKLLALKLGADSSSSYVSLFFALTTVIVLGIVMLTLLFARILS